MDALALLWLLAPLQDRVQDLVQDLQDSLGQSVSQRGKFTFGRLFRSSQSHDMLKDGRLPATLPTANTERMRRLQSCRRLRVSLHLIISALRCAAALRGP